MKPTDLKCYPQVATVIGELLADYELQRAIDSKCEFDKGESLIDAFVWDDTPQGDDFWDCIDGGKNPYDHGHERSEVKGWAYIRDTDGNNQDAWHFEKGCKWFSSDGCFYDIGYSGIKILAEHKSVTMPDWVPAYLDNIDYKPEDVSFNARLVPEKITLSKEDFDNFVTKCENVGSSEVTPYLPSLGEVCNVECSGETLVVTIVGKKLNGCLVWEHNNGTDAYRHPEAQVGKFSPYISEEDKVLQKAMEITNKELTEDLKILYDAGMLRLPEGE